jgi:hypothetical protein
MLVGIRSVNQRAANLAFVSNTVLATLGLAVPMGAGSKHHIKWWIPFSEAAAVAGAKFSLINPAAITSIVFSFIITNMVTKAIDNEGLQTAAAAFAATGASIGNYLAVFEATIINGINAGSADLQVAQQVSDPGALTFLAGSWVEDVVF